VGLQGHVSESVERVAVWIWLLFASSRLPCCCRSQADLVERSEVRRRVISAFAGIGLVVAIALAIAIFGVRSTQRSKVIAFYDVGALATDAKWTVLYVIAACGALLASSHHALALLAV